jgi:dTDP-4-amino-4,6-dideoxygalactose transaminase
MKEMIWRCDLVPQYKKYKKEINNVIDEVLLSGRYTLAEQVTNFEKEFSSFIGVKEGIGVSNGTEALALSLLCSGVSEGDEVITTPFTAIPTYAAIRLVKATPVFVDIDPVTFLIDVTKIMKAVTSRTKAVIPVHLFGNVVDVEQIRSEVGDDIFILEDCAQSHGAMINSKQTGSLGDMAAFSFYPTKNLGCYGDGGMIVTNDSDLAKKSKLLRMYGMVNTDEFITDGRNSRLDELQAAILRVKLKYLSKMNAARKRIASIYCDKLSTDLILPQKINTCVDPVFHVFTVKCLKNRDAFISYLETHNIQTNVYYKKPLYQQKPYYEMFGKHESLPVVERICKEVISLPCYPEMTDDTLYYIVDKINNYSI